MGTSTAMLTQLIQDAVLKLCTQNVLFSKSLEIDGIICISPGEQSRDVVVKMHRTIVKPDNGSDRETVTWDRDNYYQSGSTLVAPSRQAVAPAVHHPPTSPRPAPRPPPPSYSTPQKIPSATLETPGGLVATPDKIPIKEEPPSSPKPATKRSISDTQSDSSEHSRDKLPKLETKQTDYALEPGNIKREDEEPIMIELDDDDDEEDVEGGYDEDSATAGASWMGDNSMGDNTMGDNTMDGAGNEGEPGSEWSLGQPTGSSSLFPWQPDLMLPPSSTQTMHDQKNDEKQKSLQCHLCLKYFKKKAGLKFHLNSHSGIKPYKCTECGMAFVQPSPLKRHMKRKHWN